MAEKENDLIKEAKQNYNVLTGDDEVKRLAEIRLMSQLEEQAALATARDKGIEQGKKESALQIAKKMKKQKIDLKTISEATGLSREEIDEL